MFGSCGSNTEARPPIKMRTLTSLASAHDRGTTIYSVLFGGISHHQCKRRHRKNKEQFHRVTFASPTLVSTDVSDVILWHPPVVR